MLTNTDLRYHFYPAKGWLNDPNGLCFFKGKYHLFFQSIPTSEYPNGDPVHWGHAVTGDFLHFEEMAPALYPDQPYDMRGVWSGTALVKDDTMYLFYASIDSNYKQTVSVAYTHDGVHFEKYTGNPVISEHPLPCGNDFRDPAIMEWNGKYYLVIASANKEKKTGDLLLYVSDDIFHWEYVGVMMEYAGCKFCECPSLVPAGDKFILSTSVCPIESDHYFEVMYGDFDGRTFTPEIVSHFQKGPDEYAGQIFHESDPELPGRNIMITWIPGWAYQPKEKCIGCLSLPLEMKVEDGKIKAYPVKEVAHLLDENDTLVDAYIEEKFVRGGEEAWIRIIR